VRIGSSGSSATISPVLTANTRADDRRGCPGRRGI
jgi:hypothetical protein